MIYGIVKALISGVLVATASETARRSPALGALIASLPLVSVLGMIWLWRDTHDTARLADHIGATFWYILPSLPMFLVMPALLRGGTGFWPALAIGCALTVGLYLGMIVVLGRFGVRL